MLPIARALVVSLGLSLLVPAAGCAAVYPELGTALGPAPAGVPLEPAPPADRHFLRVVRATVAPRTRDGRTWEQAFGRTPKTTVKVYRNEALLLHTHNKGGQPLAPEFDPAMGGNYPVAVGDELRFELWDAGELSDHPMGLKKVTVTPEDVRGELTISFDGGTDLVVELSPPKALWGVGIWYELHKTYSQLTRVLDGSPAARAGLRRGDRILAVDGKSVEAMTSDEVRSALNAIPMKGLVLSVQHDDGATLQATLKEGPIYPVVADYDFLPAPPR